MAVISVTTTDTGDDERNWAIPPGDILDDTFVPRAVRSYVGSAAVAAKLAADQTRVSVTLTFPNNFVYLLKGISTSFISDDTVNDFEACGQLYFERSAFSYSDAVLVQLCNQGPAYDAAVQRAIRTYQPIDHFVRPFIDAAQGDQVRFSLSDQSADASTAGDVLWRADFFAFDREQVLKWPVNSPQPTFTV